MILRDKTSYFAVKIFEFSGLNDKILDKIRAVLESKCFIDENLDRFFPFSRRQISAFFYNATRSALWHLWTLFNVFGQKHPAHCPNCAQNLKFGYSSLFPVDADLQSASWLA